MIRKFDPDKILFKFKSTARQFKQRQNYFTIPKPFVDNGYIEIGKEYDVFIAEREE